KLSRGDWRREAVNQFVKRVYEGIKKEKPYVLFGISPFGIWRPGFPPSIKGFDQFDQLYADVRLWTHKGWLDFLAPQLYWPINQISQSYPILLNWWHEQNLQKKHIWPGISVAHKDSLIMIDEAINKIMIARGMNAKDAGVLHWSIAPHMKSDTLVRALQKGPYSKPALIPRSQWIDKKAPTTPSVNIEKMEKGINLKWSHPEKENLSRVIVYKKYGTTWEYTIVPIENETIFITNTTSNDLKEVRLQVVDKAGNESLVVPYIIH
ncbi:MAG TPA: family 10 glycosylhydrolase, partial [Saprospiraceae bacterium]|nr:family 10 glycosylhydrolase [Saprospiraceae bacterium]